MLHLRIMRETKIPAFFGIFFLFFSILTPATAFAEDICCSCDFSGGGVTISKSCLLIAETKLPNPNDCSSLPTNAELEKGWSCTKKLSQTECKTIAQGGLCESEPKQAIVAKGEAVEKSNKTKSTPILPSFNVPIPGLEMPEDPGLFFGAYMVAIYRYGISIAAVAATAMFIWGAFIYLIGSAGISSIQKGKEIMTDAVIGMILVFSANIILKTLNPNLVSFKSLSVTEISIDLLDSYVPDAPGITAITTPQTKTFPPKTDMAKGIIAGAEMAGADPCTVLAICDHESGLRPLWNGYLANKSKEDAIAFGPCQIVASYLHSGNPIAQSASQKFSDFPLLKTKSRLTGADKIRVGDWLLANPAGSGYIAGLLMKANLARSNGNELTAVAAYGAGAGSMEKWRKANGCKPQAGQSIASTKTLDGACVPHSVAIPNLGDAPQGCPEDKYNCMDAKADASAQFKGHCSNGRMCYAMITDSFVKYVISNYSRMVSKYSCK